ncbi:hypothetical protein D3C73_1414290 [compost metagenome]
MACRRFEEGFFRSQVVTCSGHDFIVPIDLDQSCSGLVCIADNEAYQFGRSNIGIDHQLLAGLNVNANLDGKQCVVLQFLLEFHSL